MSMRAEKVNKWLFSSLSGKFSLNRLGSLSDSHLCALSGMTDQTVVLLERSEFTTVPSCPKILGA
jgi:hypothetical protein